MTRPADELQRSEALDLRRSFIVQAPAGSGKTELLTQRFLKLLAVVDRPERLLAITFTRKAAREMQERILNRLRQASSAAIVEEDHARRAIRFAHQVLERDAARGWNLLKNPSRLRVHTIDGLCMQLLARDAERGGHIAGRAVLDNAEPLYREAVTRLFTDLGLDLGSPPTALCDALVRVLVHLDGNALALQDLLVEMLSVRDQWTGRIGIDPHSMAQVLQDRQQFEKGRIAGHLGAINLQHAMDIVSALGPALDDRDCPAARFADSMAPAVPGVAEDIRQVHLFCTVFMTSGTNARKPGGINKKLFKGLPDELNGQVLELKAIYAAWHEQPEAVAAIERMALSPPIDLEASPQGLSEDIREILKHTLAQLQVLMAERGTADFQFITESALTSLGDDDRPGQVLLDEDQRLEHILMDEFQDTSNTQMALLELLIAGWESDGSRSIFLVGDPMQSIYRFREANVGLFIDVVQKGRIGAITMASLQLQSNFRSPERIVDWVNTQFGRIFPTTDQRDSGAVSYSPASSEIGAGGAVGLHPLPPHSDDNDEAAVMLDLIRQAQSELADPTIAVLARARTHLAALAQTLVKNGIKFDAVNVDALARRPLIQDLMAITRALNHPADRTAWLALLRAPWCGLSLGQIHQLAGDDNNADLHDRINRAVTQDYGTAPEYLALGRMHQVLQRALTLRARATMRQSVAFVWVQLGGSYCYATQAELVNARAFLQLLGELERESSENLLGRLEQKLGELYAPSTASSLQLMTIHQSKGLEFDVVIIPGLHRATRAEEKPLVSLQEFRLADGRDGSLLAAMPMRGQVSPSLYAYLQSVDAERASYETQRVLYVATTRAKKLLHLVGRYKCDHKTGAPYAQRGTLLDRVLPAFSEAINEVNEAEEKPVETKSEPHPYPLLRLVNPPTLADIEIAEAVPESCRLHPLAARDAAALGDALHFWLELIHDHRDRDWSRDWFDRHEAALVSTLYRAGLQQSEARRMLPKLKAMIVNVIHFSPGKKIIDSAGKDDSWAELALYRKDGHGLSKHVIDRLYRDRDGGLNIVDYKSGEDSESARLRWTQQLIRYRSLLQKLDSGPVSGTLIHQTGDNTVIDLSRETELAQ